LNDSIALQRRFKSNGQKRQVSTVNEYLVLLIFLITVINIMAAVLTTTESTTEQTSFSNSSSQ
jgi:hypothetical protein